MSGIVIFLIASQTDAFAKKEVSAWRWQCACMDFTDSITPDKRQHFMYTRARIYSIEKVAEFRNQLSNFSSIVGPATITSKNAGDETIAVTEWAPLVDLADEDELLIAAEFARAKKGSLKVTVENGIPTFSLERETMRKKDCRNRQQQPSIKPLRKSSRRRPFDKDKTGKRTGEP